ncbi:Hypothetical predicted protein [Octopus vulgaris]|uniref:Uncharacterized protein n=1 Tax=Octopus vulgaris TaxID=6645 RepID=A0AA36F5D6_OCTVU|nr:Hypothetical predicted protein [Octopus vulgaris]
MTSNSVETMIMYEKAGDLMKTYLDPCLVCSGSELHKHRGFILALIKFASSKNRTFHVEAEREIVLQQQFLRVSNEYSC